MKKILFSFATLALAVASASDSYRVKLFQESVIAGQALKPGEYKVEVKDNKAVIKDGKRVIEADVKAESNADKFPATSVRYQMSEGKANVQEIRVGGTSTRLVFQSPAPANAN